MFNIELEEIEEFEIPKIKVVLNEIKLDDCYGNNISKKNKDVFIERTDRQNEYLLFIEEDNENEYFEYLLDEEYEIVKFDVLFLINDKEIELIQFNPNCFFTEELIKEDFLEGLLSSTYFKNTLCLAGDKPNDMFGYNIETSNYKKLALEVSKEIEFYIKSANISHIITGTELGFDTISFFAVEYLKQNGYPSLKNIVAIPFEKQGENWSNSDKARFERIKSKADYIIYVDEIPEYNIDLVSIGSYHQLKFNKRYFFMIDYSKVLLSYWSGKSDVVGNSLSYAIRKGRLYNNLYK